MIDPPLNVLWILCDELRADALGCYGHADVEVRTPNIDRLAERGTVFPNCYVTSPVCVPSRVAMLTGTHPTRTGVYGNEAVWPSAPNRLADTRTLVDEFADAGFATANFGKVHVPAPLQTWSHHDVAGSGMQDPLSGLSASEASVLRSPGPGFTVSGVVPSSRRYEPATVTDNAISWIGRSGTPFFVRVSYLQPHTPVVVPERWAKEYVGAAFRDEPHDLTRLSEFERSFAAVNDVDALDGATMVAAQQAYHGLVGWIDAEVGRLLASLEPSVAARTIVVFGSDHGAHLGELGAFGKHTFARHAHRVPLILVHPDRTPTVDDRLADTMDLPQTLLRSVGIDPAPTMGGCDLLADRGADELVSVIGYGHPESRAFPNLHVGTYGGRGWPRRACLRTSRWRFDRNVRIDGCAATPQDHDEFLVDTHADPDEIVNLAADPRHLTMLGHLRGRLDTWLDDATEPEMGPAYEWFRQRHAGLQERYGRMT